MCIHCDVKKVKVMKVDGENTKAVFDTFMPRYEIHIEFLFCIYFPNRKHHAEAKRHWVIHNKFSGFIKFEFKLENGRPLRREQSEKASSGRRRVWCDWGFNWTLWKMAIRYDNSLIAVSSAKHISHRFALISSNFIKICLHNLSHALRRQFSALHGKFIRLPWSLISVTRVVNLFLNVDLCKQKKNKLRLILF